MVDYGGEGYGRDVWMCREVYGGLEWTMEVRHKGFLSSIRGLRICG